MKNFLRIEDISKYQIDELLRLSTDYKKNRYSNALKNKVLITIFFNPSTRTKISFNLAISQLGGKCIDISPGSSSWGLEIQEGSVMNGESEEHLKDAVKVMCKYADAIAVRAFPKFINWKEERKDYLINKMAEWSNKPIINMETITHPCQALAMVKTMQEKLGKLKGKKFVLSWAYHPKPLNTAVANSAGVIASLYGMEVVVANPSGFDLDERYLTLMGKNCKNYGANFEVVHNMEQGLKDADFVYIKSWGSLDNFGKHRKDTPSYLKNWILDSKKMKSTNDAFISHCLPVRRNCLVSDSVLDSNKSLIYEEAENRLHVQKAVLKKLLEKR